MSAPQVNSLPTPGNLLASQSLGASKNVGVMYNNVTAGLAGANYPWSWDITSRMTTGGTAASTSGVSVNIYEVVGSTTITGGISASATSIVVASATGLALGQKIAIGPDGANGGEIVTISAISGTTITISATQNAHGSGAPVYILPQTATIPGATLGQNLTAANTTYSQTLNNLPGNGDFFVSLTNTDASNAVTVDITARATIGVA